MNAKEEPFYEDFSTIPSAVFPLSSSPLSLESSSPVVVGVLVSPSPSAPE